ncbi:MAG: acyclic terpene utilization AtuA family protein [Propionibacteriales bacterium]|nr:acyclic terpene utilization AtuA family protein [Propionibacteriales bacterium]
MSIVYVDCIVSTNSGDTPADVSVPEIRLLSATGMLGTGFPEESLRRGLELDPHLIGCDAGSTDAGPTDLATGRCRYPAEAYRRDLRLLLPAALGAGIPLIIGSAGGAGGDANVDWARRILQEVAHELRLGFRLAVIYSGQDKADLKKRLGEGRIIPLPNSPAVDEASIDESTTIVGVMGTEPIVAALRAGVDVVLAGRATDPSIFAALPLLRGARPGPVWHAAKILECGAAAVEHRTTPDCLFAALRGDEIVVQAPNPALRCTPTSVAAHSLYENADPFRIVEPSGTLDTTHARYEAVDDRVVRITGSRFVPADPYTVKLESVRLAGHQTVVVAGVRDPVILENLDDFLESCREGIEARVARTYRDLPRASWSVRFRVYGRDGVLGHAEPLREALPHEVGLIIEITAAEQEVANNIAATARHQTLHQPMPGWHGFLGNIALPYGANDLVRGPVYEFNMNAVVVPDTPEELFRTVIVDLPETGSVGAGV